MPAAGFEPTTSVGEQPRTYALDGAAAGICPHVRVYTRLSNVVQCTPTKVEENERSCPTGQ